MEVFENQHPFKLSRDDQIKLIKEQTEKIVARMLIPGVDMKTLDELDKDLQILYFQSSLLNMVNTIDLRIASIESSRLESTNLKMNMELTKLKIERKTKRLEEFNRDTLEPEIQELSELWKRLNDE